MRNSGRKCRKLGWIDTQLWVDAWRKLHPAKTVQAVAINLDAPPRTVEKWFNGSSQPSLTWVGPIFSAYGPEFILAGMHNPPSWLNDAAREQKKKRLAAERAAIDYEFDDLQYEGAEA